MMNIKKTWTKKVKNPEDMTEAELNSLTKMAKKVEMRDDLLYGKAAMEKKVKGTEVVGANNIFLGKCLGLNYK